MTINDILSRSTVDLSDEIFEELILRSDIIR